MIRHTFKSIASCVLLTLGSATLQAQTASVNAICSTDGPWCELAAKEFTRQTGIKVFQTHKATGEAQAQLRAEAANPKTDIWWGGTGDPYYQAAEIGLLDAYRPAYINDLHGWAVRQYAMSGNMVGGFYTSAIGFGWNEDVLKKKKLATEVLEGPAEPDLQGRNRNLAPGFQRHGLHHPGGAGAAHG